ncbi:MAG: GNAT family N-acetyltransferase [Pseudobacteriovorax sp.]|nr:GNAT family N-acetyltransferase [Pseudobacteriovorax sp.]
MVKLTLIIKESNSMDLIFRKAQKKDVATLVRLQNEGGPDGRPRKELPTVLPEGFLKAFEIISADPKQTLMVVEGNGSIVGTFHLTFLTYLAGEGKDDLQMEAFHVDAQHRGQGIGSKMVSWTIQLAQERNCRRIQLTTDKRRTDAHRFYERLGFTLSHEGAKLNL